MILWEKGERHVYREIYEMIINKLNPHHYKKEIFSIWESIDRPSIALTFTILLGEIIIFKKIDY